MKLKKQLNKRQEKITKWIAENCKSFYKFLCIFSLCCCSVIAQTQQSGSNQEKPVTGHSSHSSHGHEETKIAQKDNSKRNLVVPDVEVLTQDGKKVSFYRDLVKGKKVMINFIYTSCDLTCPMAGRNFEKLQKAVAKDVFLISVSTDPAVDTPAVLKKWSEKYHRQEAWTLVTGEMSEMQQLLLALTGSGPQRGLHTSLLVLFNDLSGQWDTTSSLSPPAALTQDLKRLEKPPAK